MIPTITSTSVYKHISPIMRKSITHLFIYILRNYVDLESIVEELGAIYDEQPLYKYTMKQLAKIVVSMCKFNEQGQTKNLHDPI